ncbi:MAG: GntR family transcriptional regulator [Clostridiales bacterium]|nr:GntR family transcriptional regulator [Candidatus Crickella merdequi]
MSKYSTLTEKIYTELCDDIACHRFESGQILTLNMLRERFDTSHTPVREALNRLISDGLVEYTANKGIRVRVYSEKEIKEMFEFAAELEVTAVRICSYSFSMAPLKADLRALIEEERVALENDDYDAWFAAADVFHTNFYKYADNNFLKEASDKVGANINTLSSYYSSHDTFRDIFKRQEQICIAIEDNNYDLAADLIRAHFQFSLYNTLKGYFIK